MTLTPRGRTSKKYGVRRFRVVYWVDRGKRVVRVFGVGHRRTICETVAAVVPSPER